MEQLLIEQLLIKEKMRAFAGLKNVGDAFIKEEDTEILIKIYHKILDEMSKIYYYSPEIKRLLRIEYPELHATFDRFDEQEFSACEKECAENVEST